MPGDEVDRVDRVEVHFIEAGLFVALTAAALGATIWLLHRRAPDGPISRMYQVRHRLLCVGDDG